MGIFAWIILGLLAGLIAKALLPGEDPGGIIVTTLLGIAGALVGGFVVRALGFGDPIDEFFDWSTWLGAIAGAVLLLALYRALFGARHTTRTT
ncbi:MAG TPA: GlsB/YeaQ/YmgE family stress response membrane protein [Gaiellaceae bacterium]|nr:GlsB/YeaQ/YmgE family stress response membrane protein [Gaiellaceae bacterium]